MSKSQGGFSAKQLQQIDVAAAAVLERLLDELTTGRGIHLESALSALGCLAGHAC